MIKDRLKEIELKITELSDYFQVSRPTMYKFIDAYDNGEYLIIHQPILDLFRYIDSDSLIGKKSAIAFIIQNTVENKSLDTQSMLKNNDNSIKNQFIELILTKSDFDDMVEYALKIYPLINKRQLSDVEINLLKPYDNIQLLMKLNTGDK
ncbi:hypothetical protein [Moraxella sp. VT-16-12]|uniref:hypothetical protein n=1 Tax=Moraxella sp. VT-16-12 TaxID=2014877 RepID=UPI000B7E331D|nr:hypothetical protein [Moraxella sp. VT-16-12]TWV83929.1 hypothetical protein CEW93_002005 [Moraxella sp. VT-16-12]